MPIFEYFVTPINGIFKFSWITVGWVIYPILGYLLENKFNIEKVSVNKILFAWAFNVLLFAISIISEYFFLKNEKGNPNETFLTIFCIYNAPLIFVTVKWLMKKYPLRIGFENTISEVGKCVFGIYLLHILFLWKLQSLSLLYTDFFENGPVGDKVGIYFTVIAVFIISGVVTFAIRSIPIIRKLL